MVEPSQEEVTRHFREMAEGKVTDADLDVRGGRRGVGGRQSRPIHYRMGGGSAAVSSVRPVQNVMSDVVATVDQAKSRLGRAIKLDVDAEGDSLPSSSHREGRSKSGKKKKRRRSPSSSKRDKKKKKRSSSSSSKRDKKKKKN